MPTRRVTRIIFLPRDGRAIRWGGPLFRVDAEKKIPNRAEQLFRIITRARVIHRGVLCALPALFSYSPSSRGLQVCAFAPFTDEPVGRKE